jgi:hypothetical protein
MIPFYLDMPEVELSDIHSYKFKDIHECPWWLEERALVLMIVDCADGLHVVVME